MPTLLETLLLTALLASCPTSSAEPEHPPRDIEAPEYGADQHFCCKDVDDKTFVGEECTAIPKELVNQCARVLYCAGNYTKRDGTVTCG